MIWVILGVIATVASYFFLCTDFFERAFALKSWQEEFFKKLLEERRDTALKYLIETNEDDIRHQMHKFVEKLEQSGANRPVIQLLPNGQVELARFSYTSQWRPIPAMLLNREIIEHISLDKFFFLFTRDAKNSAFQELRQRVAESYKEQFKNAGNGIVPACAKKLAEKAHREFSPLFASAKESHLNASLNRVKNLVQRIVDKALRNFRAEVAKVGRGEIQFILAKYRGQLIKELRTRISPLLRGNLPANAEEILPRGARFFLHRGRSKLIVVEQKPQVRSVRIASSLSGIGKEKLFKLAFPFIIFLMEFYDDGLRGLRVYYRNRPLESLDDELFKVNLTNVNGDGSVCLGFPGHHQAGFLSRVGEVIAHFWNSAFNTDISGRYQEYCQRESRLNGIRTWESHSTKDPLFPLSIDWLNSASLRRRVNELVAHFPDTAEAPIEDEISRAFTISDEDLQEALLKRVCQIKVVHKYNDVVAEALNTHEEQLIKDAFGAVEESFGQACKEDDGIGQALTEALFSAVEKTLTENFDTLAKETLIRRKVNVQQLEQMIREE